MIKDERDFRAEIGEIQLLCKVKGHPLCGQVQISIFPLFCGPYLLPVSWTTLPTYLSRPSQAPLSPYLHKASILWVDCVLLKWTLFLSLSVSLFLSSPPSSTCGVRGFVYHPPSCQALSFLRESITHEEKLSFLCPMVCVMQFSSPEGVFIWPLCGSLLTFCPLHCSKPYVSARVECVLQGDSKQNCYASVVSTAVRVRVCLKYSSPQVSANSFPCIPPSS